MNDVTLYAGRNERATLPPPYKLCYIANCVLLCLLISNLMDWP